MSKKEVIKDSEIIEDEVGNAKKIKKYIENGKARKIKKNLTKKEIDDNDESIKNDRALFTKRFLAYCIDMLIVFLISSLIATPFVDSKELNNTSEELNNIIEEYQEKKITVEEYSARYENQLYNLAREQGVLSLIIIVMLILYFIVYQTYNNGQTLGKKLLKIRVVSETSDLNMNQMILRAFVVDNLLLYIVSFVFMLFLSKVDYFNSLVIAGYLQIGVTIVSAFMVMFRKDGKGLHDILCKTNVIKA